MPIAKALSSSLILLATAVVAAGCADSGGGGGGSGSTAAAGVSTAGPIPQAPPNQGTGVGQFNREFQAAWNHMRPGVLALLQQEASNQAGTVYSRGAIRIEVVNVRTVQSQMQVAPGLERLTHTELGLRIPSQGTWDLVFEADVRVRIAISGSLAPHVDLPVTISITGLSALIEADFDVSDPARPVFQRVGQPQITFALRIDSTSSLLRRITPALTPLANLLAQTALNRALSGMLPTLQGLQGLPGPIPAAGALPWADSGAPVAFEAIMLNIDRKIARDNLPYGQIVPASMDVPSLDSWEAAFAPGGPGNPGVVVTYGSGGDSALFTGMYLGTQAFRYAVTGERGNLDAVLAGVGRQLDVNGNGLLARCAAPVGSQIANAFPHPYKTTSMGGQDWVGEQGDNGISRDQYSGTFFGLSIAWELVGDPAVRAECQRLLELMLDYLIANEWAITEDRTPLGPGGSRGPTFWAGVANQKVTYLLMGHRINPAKYATELAVTGSVSEQAWLAAWVSAFGLDHYYKFNLSHLAYYNLFRLETDPQRWQDFARAFSMIRRYVANHKNPHFDLIAASADPSTSAVYYPQSREVMRRFLKRNHRSTMGPVVDLSGVTFVPFTQGSYQNGSGAALSFQTTTVQIPSEPLDIVLRAPHGQLIWQSSPFTPGTPNQGSDLTETVGIDAVLPYWLGRYLGAF